MIAVTHFSVMSQLALPSVPFRWRKLFPGLVFSGLILLPVMSLMADWASQQFLVHVPVSSSVIAPEDVSIVHDFSENPQRFAPQSWSVRGNSVYGMVVDFSIDSPFQSPDGGPVLGDAQLGVSVSPIDGPAIWTASRAAAQTSHANGIQNAHVRIQSSGVGAARVDLSVAMVNPHVENLAAGQSAAIVVSTTMTVQ